MRKSRLTVVYADDDDLMREAITAVLIQQDMDVHACADGIEAIALSAQLDPDVILLDLNMPDLDGLRTARELRQGSGNRSMRLIALTGQGTWELRKKALDAGFDEFLTKPIPVDVLIGALRRS